MSDTIIAAIIGAVATVAVALLGCWIALRNAPQPQRANNRRAPVMANNMAPDALPHQIIEAVKDGRLAEPFSIADVTRLFPNAFQAVLANNAEGGNYNTGYFIRVERGLYRIADRWRDRV